MWVRRALVTGVIAASLVAGGAGGAGAAGGGGGNGHGRDQCARLAAGKSDVERQIARFDRRIQRLTTGPNVTQGDAQGRVARLEARKARMEQKFQALQASCNT